MNKKVLIAGGSGFSGKVISAHLLTLGYQVTWLTRKSTLASIDTKSPYRVITWEDLPTLQNDSYDVIINLCGANILSHPWTKKRKQILLSSRVGPTQNLIDYIQQCPPSHQPALWINASAVGIYDQLNQDCDEHSVSHLAEKNNFLKSLATAWENKFYSFSNRGKTRLVSARFGVILDKAGGMLKPCSLAFYLGLGGRLGSGKQIFPWISLHDVCRAIEFIISSPIAGPVNFTSPDFVTNQEFTNALAKALRRLAIFPVPAFILKLILGGRSDLLLKGCRAKPKKLLDAGFTFEHSNIKQFLTAHFTK